jgi:hypothetical protein
VHGAEFFSLHDSKFRAQAGEFLNQSQVLAMLGVAVGIANGPLQFFFPREAPLCIGVQVKEYALQLSPSRGTGSHVAKFVNDSDQDLMVPIDRTTINRHGFAP